MFTITHFKSILSTQQNLLFLSITFCDWTRKYTQKYSQNDWKLTPLNFQFSINSSLESATKTGVIMNKEILRTRREWNMNRTDLSFVVIHEAICISVIKLKSCFHFTFPERNWRKLKMSSQTFQRQNVNMKSLISLCTASQQHFAIFSSNGDHEKVTWIKIYPFLKSIVKNILLISFRVSNDAKDTYNSSIFL